MFGADNTGLPIFNECWCFINVEEHKAYLFVIYALYWLIIVINFLIILKVIRFLRQNCDSSDVRCIRIRNMCNRLYLYPLITLICFTFATIHRSYQIFNLKVDLDSNLDLTTEQVRIEIILYLLHGMFICFRGFLYFLVYGFDEKVKKELVYIFGKVFKKRDKDKDYVNLTV
jgi:hypothetical protein